MKWSVEQVKPVHIGKSGSPNLSQHFLTREWVAQFGTRRMSPACLSARRATVPDLHSALLTARFHSLAAKVCPSIVKSGPVDHWILSLNRWLFLKNQVSNAPAPKFHKWVFRVASGTPLARWPPAGSQPATSPLHAPGLWSNLTTGLQERRHWNERSRSLRRMMILALSFVALWFHASCVNALLMWFLLKFP